MSDKFGDERDPYLYPALNVMRNRLGIRQAQRLEQAAWEMTAARAATLPLGRGRGYPISALFIISSIRMSSTGRAVA
jgi:cell filamentation protein